METSSIPVSQLRAHLASVIAAVEGGQRVLLTRHDRVVAALVPPAEPAPTPLEARAAHLLAALSASPSGDGLPNVVERPSLDPERWVAEIIAGRA